MPTVADYGITPAALERDLWQTWVVTFAGTQGDGTPWSMTLDSGSGSQELVDVRVTLDATRVPKFRPGQGFNGCGRH